MAKRALQISLPVWLGGGAAALILLLTLGTLLAVFGKAQGTPAPLGPADWAAVRFTLFQAFLSAAISVLLAIPLARALARRSFVGRRILISLMGAPFILPVIVAVLGLLAIFGRGGIISKLLEMIGLGPVSIYGLGGVLLAHVFFNLPFATRLILHGWLSIPAERFRLAASLGFTARETIKWLERPMLRSVLPGTFMVVFLICMTSFAVVLALGGGPRATTIELAIYQAFRFDFDLGKAAQLATLQFILGGLAATIALMVSVPSAMGGGLDRQVKRWDARNRILLIQDAGLILLAAVFLLTPLAAIFTAGFGQVLTLPVAVWHAAGRSLIVALGSTLLLLGLALPLSMAIIHLKQRRGAALLLELISYLTIAASPLVIGTGLFIILFPHMNPVAYALPITALVNAVMSLPYALRVLTPALRDVEKSLGPLADSLGITGFTRLRLLILPRIRRALGFSAGLAAALSMGDLGVISLFSAPGDATLPLQLYRLMSAYRMADAAGAALLLLFLSFALFWLFDKGARIDADT